MTVWCAHSLTFKSNILVSWVYKSHEQLQLGRHSQTPQNFSYYHAKLVFDLSSCSFHPKRLVVSAYKQCHVLPSAINLAYSGKTSIATVARRGSTTSGATSRSVNGKVLINPSTWSINGLAALPVSPDKGSIHTKSSGYKFICMQGGANNSSAVGVLPSQGVLLLQESFRLNLDLRFHKSQWPLDATLLLHAQDCCYITCKHAPQMHVLTLLVRNE